METVGKYTVEGTLGRGGMGVVYRAHDPVIGRDVAVKMIVDQAVADPTVRRRFLAEAQRAGSLNHPNIVTIYDVGEEDGRPFIVMEVLAGSDLRHVIDEGEPLPLSDRLRIAVQVAQALGFAHHRSVLHRDVKPENVFVTQDGTAKVLDFGIARLESDSDTVTQAVVGTPRYMSPEQVRGGSLDCRTDIYSFGMVLYEMLGGANPYAGYGVHTVLYKVLHEDPPPVPLPEGAPAALRDIVSRCIAKAPEDRYASFDDVVAALRAVIQERPVPAAAPLRRPRRGQPVVLAAAAVGVAVAAAWLISEGGSADTPSYPERAEATPGESAPLAPGGDVDTSAVRLEAPTGALDDSWSTPPAAPRPAPPAPAAEQQPSRATQVTPGAVSPPPSAAPSPTAQSPPPVAERSDPATSPGPRPINPAPPPAPARTAPEATARAQAEEARQQAARAVERIGQALEAAMEAQDPGALQRVHGFYSQMSPFFQIAEDVRASVATSDVTVAGDRATATVSLSFTFENKTQNNRRESQRIQYEWTLLRSGSQWALADVQSR